VQPHPPSLTRPLGACFLTLSEQTFLTITVTVRPGRVENMVNQKERRSANFCAPTSFFPPVSAAFPKAVKYRPLLSLFSSQVTPEHSRPQGMTGLVFDRGVGAARAVKLKDNHFTPADLDTYHRSYATRAQARVPSDLSLSSSILSIYPGSNVPPAASRRFGVDWASARAASGCRPRVWKEAASG
jgi:hypothetical protein